MTPIDVINQLRKAKNSAEKQAVLSTAWTEECYEFFEGVHFALNPIINFDLTVVPKIVDEDNEPDELGFAAFRQLALDIYHKKAKNINKVIEDALNRSSVEAWNKWYRNILLKTLGCITISQFNKFLNSIDETDLLIPIFKYQKISNHPRLYLHILGEYCI